MTLNHLNLTVTDVPATRAFLEQYFGLRSMGGNANITLLSDDNGLALTLTSMKIGNETEVKYPATFHIGFGQEREEGVNEINRRLKEGGFDGYVAYEMCSPVRGGGNEANLDRTAAKSLERIRRLIGTG